MAKKPTPVRTSTVTLQGQAPPTKIPFLYGLSAAYIHAEITGQLRTVPADHIPEIWVLTASHLVGIHTAGGVALNRKVRICVASIKLGVSRWAPPVVSPHTLPLNRVSH